MLLPIGDEPNPRGFVPWVNYSLIFANVGLFLLLTLPLTLSAVDLTSASVQDFISELMRRMPDATRAEITTVLRDKLNAYDVFCQHWGYRPADPSLRSLFSSMFLHVDWKHLLFNMLFLYIFGDNVEHRLGRVAYLCCYLTCGIMATLAFALLTADSYVPLVGASGAISGVLGFYFLWFPRNLVRIFVFLIFYIDVWRVPTRVVLGVFLLVDNVLPWVLTRGSNAGSGVAYGAHLGGFVTGLGIAWVVDRTRRAREDKSGLDEGRKKAAYAEDLKNTGSFGVGAEAVVDSHTKGYLPAAVHAYLELLPSQRKKVPAAIVASLGDWLREREGHDAALLVYRQGLVDHRGAPDSGALMLGVGRALLAKGEPMAAYRYLRDAAGCDDDGVAAEASGLIDEIVQKRKGGGEG